MLAYINLGANISPRLSYLEQAAARIGGLTRCKIIGQSRIYETPAVHLTTPRPSPFYNLCMALKIRSPVRTLLEKLQAIEEALGRPKADKGRHRARVIDLDIVLSESLILDEPDLVIPHPGLTTRSFFLWPLLEICPGAVDPRTETPLKSYLSRPVPPPILRVFPAPWNSLDHAFGD